LALSCWLLAFSFRCLTLSLDPEMLQSALAGPISNC
jgi:hypothetical protein